MYTFFEDAGHGWLRVSKREIDELGIKPSQYSYQTQNYVYLEEDCDLSLFLRKKQTDDSVKPYIKWVINHLEEWWEENVKETYSPTSHVRNYERCPA